MLKHIFSLIICFLALSAPAHGETGQFEYLSDTALSYFVPLKGTVTEAEDGVIACSLGEESGIKNGMRLKILREGATFVHPITKETIGHAEQFMGIAEVTGVGPESSTLEVISGEAKTGDVLRLSSAKVVALFYQSPEVDWNLSEEYYFRLKDTGRFQLIDTEPDAADDSQIREKAKQLGAEVAIVLGSEESAFQTVLRQRLLWVEPAGELSSVEVTLDEETTRKYKLGEEYFAPAVGQSILTFPLPYSSRILTTGDLDGDGEPELILSTGRNLRAYHVGSSLKPALDGRELEGVPAGEHVWLEAHDLDGNGRDDIVITVNNGGTIRSAVYTYSDGKFVLLWEGKIFIRVINGILYGQESSLNGGYRGEVFPVRWQEENPESPARQISLPEKTNIYDFNYMNTGEKEKTLIAYDGRGRLHLLDRKGQVVWQSEDYSGGIARVFRKDPLDVVQGSSQWHVPHRITISEESALLLRRTPITSKASGIGYKSAELVRLYSGDSGIQEEIVLDGLPGNISDYALSGRKLFILADSYKPDFGKLLRGRGFFTTRLYVFTLKGY